MTSIRADGAVEFRFYRPEAKEMKVVGDFNRWTGQGCEMWRDDQGWWTIVIPLHAGDYRFRYLSDGFWYTDYAAFGLENTPMGWNSILSVPRTADCLMDQNRMRAAA